MLEVGGEPDLAQEALGAQDGSQLTAQQLESHWAVVLEVAREVDRGHASAPQLALEHVAILDCGHKTCWKI